MGDWCTSRPSSMLCVMSLEGPEREPLSYEQVVAQSEREALRRVRDRFERSPNARNNLDFHNTQHTEDVVRRTLLILQAMRKAEEASVPERALGLGRVAAAWHDAVQNYQVVEVPAKEVPEEGVMKLIGRRTSIANERESAEESIAYLKELAQRRGAGGALTSEDEQEVRDAIYVTVPEYNANKGTIYQPFLRENSSLVARAVALADIGAAGMDGPKKFESEGNAVFREDNIDITEALAKGDPLPQKQKEHFRLRMAAWGTVQINFAVGRKALIDEELQGLSEPMRRAVKYLFTTFDATIAAAQARASEMRDATFEDLARTLGYQVTA